MVRKSNSLPYYLVRSFARRRMYTLAIDIYLPTLKNVVHSNPIIYIYIYIYITLFHYSFTHSYIEGLSTTTFSFGIGILKGKFGGQFRFGPIHGGTNHIEQCHGFNINVNIVV